MDQKEKILCILSGISVIIAASFLLYGSPAFSVILIPYLFYYFRKQTKKKKEAQKWLLNIQFSDALKSLSTALEAGYSVENGIAEAYKDLSATYKEDDLIMIELKNILGKIRNRVSAEEAFSGFAGRSGLEDVRGFADVFATAQRTGGNIIAIIRSTTDMIRRRVDLKREVRTATASAKYEADIMKIIPFGVLLYLRVFSPDMISSLYGNIRGMVFMTGILAVYLVLSEVTDRIVRIEL